MKIIAQANEVTNIIDSVSNSSVGVAVAALGIWAVFYAFWRLMRGGIEVSDDPDMMYDEESGTYVDRNIHPDDLDEIRREARESDY